MKKTLSLLILVVLSITLCTTPAFAGIGESDYRYRYYDGNIVKEATPDYAAQLADEYSRARFEKNADKSVVPGGGTKVTVASSGGSHFSRDNAIAQLNSAISSADVGSKSVALRLIDLDGKITIGDFIVLRNMANNKNLDLTVYTDYTGSSDKVDFRVSINRGSMDSDIVLGRDSLMETDIKATFNSKFNNDIKVISLKESGNFSAPVSVAILLPADMARNNLKLYSYNTDNHKYSSLSMPDYYIDNNGYLHFSISTGGSYIVSDGILSA